MDDQTTKTPAFQLIARGRRGGKPTFKATRGGQTKVISTGRLAVHVPDRSVGAAPSDRQVVWLRLVAFDGHAEYLSGHEKGEEVTVTGALRFSAFVGRDGVRREVWECAVDYLESERTWPLGLKRPPRPVLCAAPAPAPAEMSGGPPDGEDEYTELDRLLDDGGAHEEKIRALLRGDG